MSTSAASCSTTSTCIAVKTNNGAVLPCPALKPAPFLLRQGAGFFVPPQALPGPPYAAARVRRCTGPKTCVWPKDCACRRAARFSAHWGKFLRLCRTCFRFALKIRRIMSRFVAYLSFSVAVNCRSEEFLRHTRKFLSSDAFIAAYSMSSRDFGLPATDSRHNRALPATDSHRIRLSEIDLDDDADPNHETHQQEHERHDDIGRTADGHRTTIPDGRRTRIER